MYIWYHVLMGSLEEEYDRLLDLHMRLRAQKNHMAWERNQALARSLEIHKAYLRIRDKLMIARESLRSIKNISDENYGEFLAIQEIWSEAIDALENTTDSKPLAYKW